MRTLSGMVSFALVGACALSSAHAQDGLINAHLTPIGGLHQQVIVDTELPQRFALRATRDDGTPIAGLEVGFSDNFCIPLPMLPDTCPPQTLWGTFPLIGNDRQPNVNVITDADGIATTPVFTAGTTPGTYTVYAYLAWPQTVGNETFRHASGELFPQFEIVQVIRGGGVTAVAAPTLGTPTLWLEGLAVLALGLWATRRVRA